MRAASILSGSAIFLPLTNAVIITQNEDNPFWIPERLTRKIQTDQGNTDVPRLGDVQGVNNKERAALGDNVDISTPNDGDV